MGPYLLIKRQILESKLYIGYTSALPCDQMSKA